jgi:hypothetical protein
VLYHLNAEALRTQSPEIELEDSLTALVKRTLGLDPKGRNIRTVKDQLTRLSASDFRIGTVTGEGRAVTVKGSVIEARSLSEKGTFKGVSPAAIRGDEAGSSASLELSNAARSLGRTSQSKKRFPSKLKGLRNLGHRGPPGTGREASYRRAIGS